MNKLLLTTFCLTLASSAFGTTVTCLTNNSGQCATLAADISVFGNGNLLTISNLGPLASAIDAIYFDPTPDNSISGITIGSSIGTVAFQLGGNPSNLPAANLASPVFQSLFNISSTSNANRIDPGESLVVSATGGNLADLFNSGFIRIGLHIQSVGTSNMSESLVVQAGTATPEPGTIVLLGAGIGLLFLGRKFSSR